MWTKKITYKGMAIPMEYVFTKDWIIQNMSFITKEAIIVSKSMCTI